MNFTSFRGFDLTVRKQKIANAMNLVPPKSAEDVPVLAHTPCYFGFGNHPRPVEYWQDPAVMLSFQQDAYEKHLKLVNDDMVPYFMPWFGTGVLASAFGCKMRDATGNGDDPALVEHIITDVEQLAHLKMPVPGESGWMPRVTKFMEYAVQHGEMPVGLTDMNSPLCTAAQICGYENLFYWMYDEPEAIHDLMSMICEAFTEWTKCQKNIIGEPMNMSNGLQGVYTPRGGVWMSDDDLVSVSGELYEEFVLPYYKKVFAEFGGGHLHWCGIGNHQIDNILQMDSVKIVNNSPMSHFDKFHTLYKSLSGKFAIEIQDNAPINPDSYYGKLFENINNMTGIIVAPFAPDTLGLGDDGLLTTTDIDPITRANAVVNAVRKYAGKIIANQNV